MHLNEHEHTGSDEQLDEMIHIHKRAKHRVEETREEPPASTLLNASICDRVTEIEACVFLSHGSGAG